MRVVVFFDLPVETAEQRRSYRRFRKFLIKSGFVMIQESVYTKITPNSTVAGAIAEKVRKNSAPKGLVQMLIVTEKQFEKMEIIVGEAQSTIIDSDERLVVL